MASEPAARSGLPDWPPTPDLPGVAELQTRALGGIMTGRPLAETLGLLAQAVESHAGSRCLAVVLLLDRPAGRFRLAAAPSAPEVFSAMAEGLHDHAELAVTLRSGRDLISVDLAEAAGWKDLAQRPQQAGLRAGWWRRIVGPDGELVGAFGAYFRILRGPTHLERDLMGLLAKLAALALVNQRPGPPPA